MCANCISNAEVVIGKVILAAAILKDPAHRALHRAGLATAPDPVKHDVRTVAFLHSLDLDPVEILGADAVAAAARWVPQPQPARLLALLGFCSVRPIGSQSLASAQ